MEGHDGAGGRRLPESDVGDAAGGAEHANAALLSAGECDEALGYVAAGDYFHGVGFECVGAVPGDDDGGLGLVLGARGAAAGPADGFSGGDVWDHDDAS